MNVIIANHPASASDLSAYFTEKNTTFIERVVEIYHQRSFPSLAVFSNLIDDLEQHDYFSF